MVGNFTEFISIIYVKSCKFFLHEHLSVKTRGVCRNSCSLRVQIDNLRKNFAN